MGRHPHPSTRRLATAKPATGLFWHRLARWAVPDRALHQPTARHIWRHLANRYQWRPPGAAGASGASERSSGERIPA